MILIINYFKYYYNYYQLIIKFFFLSNYFLELISQTENDTALKNCNVNCNVKMN